MDKQTLTELEAAAFRRLVTHLQNRTDVQNIDLMNLSGFCRNCMSRWMVEEATAQEVDYDMETARLHVYGMPYAEYKDKYQTPATPEQLARFEQTKPKHEGS